MAQYRLDMRKPVQRSQGRSAVAMAAYRSAEKLTDDRLGIILNFAPRHGVVHSEIVTPADAPRPGWADNRGAFWNRVEAAEKRVNSQVAREIVLSLPHELDAAARRELTLDFARYLADRHGIGVDVSIHLPSDYGDHRNHHAHLLMSTRRIDAESAGGFGAKVRDLDAIAQRQAGKKGTEVEHLREVWERMQNQALQRADIRDAQGEIVQLDRRSYERQGIDQEPTIKEGVSATQIKRKGEHSDIAAANEEIRRRNAAAQERRFIAEQVERIKTEMAEFYDAVRTYAPIKTLLLFERRRKELDPLQEEIAMLLAVTERSRTRTADEMNRMLLPRPELPRARNDNSKLKPFPGQTPEHFERELKERAARAQAPPEPKRDDGEAIRKRGYSGPKL